MKNIFILFSILFSGVSNAQLQTVKPLSIGDTVPDIILNHIINYKTSTAKLSDFKGDLILLDFWSTWCSACIKGFSKMDSLKKEYQQLQVLLVNTKSWLSKDDETKIRKTLKNFDQRTGNNIQLPIVYDNPLLDTLFPVLYLPQVIWIKRNRVIAITGSDEVNARNISTVLRNESLTVHFKKDMFSYDTKTPLFIKGNGGNEEQLLYRSLLTPYIEGIGSRSGYRINNHKMTGLYILNQPLLSLIKKAFDSLISYSDNRIIIESKNENFISANTEDSKYSHSYCYELVIPPSTEKQVKKYMQDDLKKYFRISVHNEMRLMRCLVLYKKNRDRTPVTNGTGKDFDLQEDSKRKFIYNEPIPLTLRLLNEYSQLPLIDETTANFNVSIDLPFDLTDVKALKTSFEKVGFDLKEEEREIEVTVITDL